ncbi:MAG: hypothetical protein WDN00_02045 [Limisphaerales bacterium]
MVAAMSYCCFFDSGFGISAMFVPPELVETSKLVALPVKFVTAIRFVPLNFISEFELTLVTMFVGVNARFVPAIELIPLAASDDNEMGFLFTPIVDGAVFVPAEKDELFVTFPVVDVIRFVPGPFPAGLLVSAVSDGNSGTVTCRNGFQRIKIPAS